jgi:ATP-dependent DNA helicase RecG
MSLKDLKGVGETTYQHLLELGITKPEDLLWYAPRRYQAYQLGLRKGLCTVEAHIISAPTTSRVKGNLQILRFDALIENQTIKCTLFGRNYMANQLQPGVTKFLTGTYENGLTVQEVQSQFQAVRPIYKTGGVKSHIFIGLIDQMLAKSVPQETLSEIHLSAYKLLPIHQYLPLLHHPRTMEDVKHVMRRAKYEELLYYQLLAKYMRSLDQTRDAGLHFSKAAINQFIASLPFALTIGQTTVVREILADLSSTHPMYRLLQGDVGSGKTVVAMIAMIAAVQAGYQAVLMVPTDILASQHYRTFLKLAKPYHSVLLTRTHKSKEIYHDIACGKAQIIIGTHALFQEAVDYHHVGLVVADEQHRFGVEQRKAMLQKAIHANLLSMSATPIPRTLAIGLFGDMDVSTIEELPKNRLPITTKVVPLAELKSVLSFVQEQIKAKRQTYVVTSVIEESAQGMLDAVRTQELLASKLKGRVELLHGKMVSEEKDRVMNQFKQGYIDVLVSTTVIEVGVDVPNATVMIIFDAQRFGLSQLHQLRGRIGRGDQQSYCFLVYQESSEESIDRLHLLETTHNGFAIAEEDLAIRGPGEFLGNQQSGFPQFRFSDLIADVKILQIAAKDAEDIVYNKQRSEYQMYHQYLSKKVGESYDSHRD